MNEKHNTLDLPTRNRYHFEVTVVNIEERKQTIRSNWRRDPNDPTGTKNICDEVTISQGWYVRLSDSSAMYFGMEKLDFVKGDVLEVTATKKFIKIKKAQP